MQWPDTCLHQVRKDLIYEGITTKTPESTRPRMRVRKDLIYEGITTWRALVLVTESPVRKDLIYEGITTRLELATSGLTGSERT